MANEQDELIPINIGNINDGAVFDMFEREMRRVWDNICDLSTPATVEKHKSKVFLGKTEENALIAFTSDPRQMALWHAPKPKDETPVISFKQAEKK